MSWMSDLTEVKSALQSLAASHRVQNTLYQVEVDLLRERNEIEREYNQLYKLASEQVPDLVKRLEMTVDELRHDGA